MNSILEERDISVNEKMETDQVNNNESNADYSNIYPKDSKTFKNMSLNEMTMNLSKFEDNEADADLLKIYTHDLQMYKDPPTGQISLEKFEKLGAQRLEVLRIIDRLSKQVEIKYEDMKECLLSGLKQKGLEYYVRLIKSPGSDTNSAADIEMRRRDHISHFILRLALCRNQKTLDWFINLEQRLFWIRFASLNDPGIENFLALYNFDYPTLSEEQKNEHRENLIAVHDNIDVDKTVIYKVPYLRARKLVKDRKIFLHRGFVFVPRTEMIHVTTQAFKEFLKAQINVISIKAIRNESRLEPILKNLFTFTDTVILPEITSIPLDSLDELAEKSYPLCMKIMHEALRKVHHLKNGARLQYGVFLKLIGISYDCQVDFFKEEFLKTMDICTFENSYLYYIQHIYGKVGRRIEYKTFSCKPIIESKVGFGEYHGCPYKNMTEETLRSNLKKLGIEEEGIEEIEDLAKDQRYREACTKCFHLRYQTPLNELIESPSTFFFKSQNIVLRERRLKEKKEKERLEKEKIDKEKAFLATLENADISNLELSNWEL
ncbi:DNA primase large subunit isoform X1 [Belonocnema kinseyi]|uniref:DNA primase large subunit isoform X1 n=1 Tax=Belonocnema kinseyi TaxID=2817044 RepID=UPI00143D3B3B|nr:DNA primase large subunit isoform X1 [Belonocnema kinseyi]XP_033230046.1 DNA primase large subunit isoform X1 [Belonocnema kinseyi]XP_033230047.1 DNA primase large subunit isoform X1 [Belonocnema kinseyi]XP_033230048.1 DNA primase large subunit isoform X1 [Belonocnema kinseyi]XP_033230049.1 DNA primase large subunit isoform X1 [Belonocnema kinseyi]